MRLLGLIFKLSVIISLLSYNSESFAVAVSLTNKEQKQFHKHFKDKAPNNIGDVWERIRLGMKIHHTNPVQALAKSVQVPEQHSAASPSAFHPDRTTVTATVAPAVATNSYTALGLKLKFGTKMPAAIHDNCMPTLSTITRQEPVKKFKNYDVMANEQAIVESLNPQLRKHTILGGALTKALNNSTPCNKYTDKPLTKIAGNPIKQPEIVEKINTKKSIINDRINKQIALFTQSPGYLHQVTERARPYLYHIVEGLSSNQLPLELALLPIVESGYQPMAFSPKGAAGLWQFIPSTGKDYDLKQSNHYDERLDILASTRAAIRFLSDLKDHFNGDWLLALAAYNCGQGAVDKAINRNLDEGLETDYWSLRLPEETQDYVPRLLALSNIFANPANYGLKFTPLKNEPYFVKVKINREVDIKYLTDKKFSVLARLSNMSHEQFNLLNPGYLNPELSNQEAYTFLLPHANAEQLHQLLTHIAQFMDEPVPLITSPKKIETNAFPYAWDLSANPSSIKLIRSSLLSTEIY